MYGSWRRGERPRKRGKKYRIIGSSQGLNMTDNKRKSWEDIMRENQERERGKKAETNKKKGQEQDDQGRWVEGVGKGEPEGKGEVQKATKEVRQGNPEEGQSEMRKRKKPYAYP